MRILVVIANFGTKNDSFMQRLLQEYAGMSHQVHPVLLTNVAKNMGEHVEVIVQSPRGDPWTFPFPHKKILAERIQEYDLFIYTEDDTLISERNIQAFLEATEVLHEDEIAGFIRSERGPDGEVHFSTAHYHFHWDPASVVSRGTDTFAFFTNEHSACYILTRDQLKRAIDSGGFLVEPHQGQYDLLVSAATDPYTQCGFKKLVCVSHLEDFILPHLPNKYVGKLGLRDTEMFTLVRALDAVAKGARPRSTLLRTDTRLGQFKWSKSYYEPAREEVLNLLPKDARRILSYGCGWGEMEAELGRRGIDVTALPLDSVIGACAEARGVKVIYGDSDSALAQVAGEKFDCVIASDLLHRIPEPERLLRSFSGLLNPGGAVVATLPNLSQISIRWRRVKRDPTCINLGTFARSGLHHTSYGRIREWFEKAGFTVQKTVSIVPERGKKLSRIVGRLGDGLLAEEFIFAGRRK